MIPRLTARGMQSMPHGRAPIHREAVNLSDLANAVVADLRRAHPNRKVTADLSDGLRADGDRRLLEVALTNLIGNAWKFTAGRENARIELGRTSADETTFFVRDNGAGFDVAYAKRLFSPFERLHQANEFQGTGVGLATVERVISRHGGKIWAEAAVDRGATFFFTLPERGESVD